MPAVVDFRLEAVLRQPQVSGAPTLTKLGGLGTDRIDLVEQHNDVPELRFTVHAEALEDDIRIAFRNLRVYPLECWMYLDGASTPIFAGPIMGLGPSRAGTSVVAKGLLHYLAAMAVEVDAVYTATDLALIVKDLVDDFQARERGDFGIVTTGIAALGVTGDHTYLVEEQHRVLRRVADLAVGRFDYRVNPSTRALEVAATLGSDLSASVAVDRRNVVDPGASVSVEWDDVAGIVLGQGTGPEQAAFTATATNAAVLASYGRVAAFASWSDVQSQAELNSRTAAHAAARVEPLFTPSLNLLPVADAGVGDFTVGDWVLHRFDYGFGLLSSTERIGTRRIAASRQTGETTISVGFL